MEGRFWHVRCGMVDDVNNWLVSFFLLPLFFLLSGLLNVCIDNMYCTGVKKQTRPAGMPFVWVFVDSHSMKVGCHWSNVETSSNRNKSSHWSKFSLDKKRKVATGMWLNESDWSQVPIGFARATDDDDEDDKDDEDDEDDDNDESMIRWKDFLTTGSKGAKKVRAD